MQITQHKHVTLEYVLTDGEGKLIDSSADGEHLSYVHGTGSIFPVLEEALAGKATGDELQVSLAPENAFGERDQDLVHDVERAQFEPGVDIHPGMHVTATAPDGELDMVVVSADDEKVTLDANHPLAGMTLNFQVKVAGVRDATPEELVGGHTHGPGCSHGHEHGEDN